MKILMVGLGTFEEMTGGSARYMSGLRDSLTALGHEIEVRTASSRVGSPGYVQAGLRGQVSRSLRRALVHIPSPGSMRTSGEACQRAQLVDHRADRLGTPERSSEGVRRRTKVVVRGPGETSCLPMSRALGLTAPDRHAIAGLVAASSARQTARQIAEPARAEEPAPSEQIRDATFDLGRHERCR